jgi:hypothetical protein
MKFAANCQSLFRRLQALRDISPSLDITHRFDAVARELDAILEDMEARHHGRFSD